MNSAPPPARRVDLLVIHCLATPNGRWVSTVDVDQWHAQRGFKRADGFRAGMNPDLAAIGYHWVVYPNGAPATGRHPAEIGAHARGFNARSLGLALAGTDAYTLAQWDSLAKQVDLICRVYGIPRQFASPRNGYRGVCGHRDLSPDANANGEIEPREWLKTCPGFSVADWLKGGMVPLAAHAFNPLQKEAP
jgi:hypothetical protein